MHFQYIRSNDRAGGYDFFQLTAGPEPLAQAARHLGLPDQEPLPA
jgi:hypothetical protein